MSDKILANPVVRDALRKAKNEGRNEGIEKCAEHLKSLAGAYRAQKTELKPSHLVTIAEEVYKWRR